MVSGLHNNLPMKRLSILLVAILFLAACSNSPESNVAPTLPSVPNDCRKTEILAAFPEKIPNPKFIETEWEPAEGTDLYSAYNAGGIACSYGIQEAEIGATILWSPDNLILFSELTPRWIAAGQKEIDIPGVEEEKAYVLTEGVQGEGEYHVWAINLLIDGIWIQVSATFFDSLESAIPLVNAAVESLRSPKQAAKTNLVGCYMAELPEDLYVLNIDYHDNNTVSADIYYKNINSDPSRGVFVGSYTNGVIRGFYNFTREALQSERELFFKGDKTGFVTATGPMKATGSIESFKRPLQLTWNEEYKYIPAEDCEALLKE